MSPYSRSIGDILLSNPGDIPRGPVLIAAIRHALRALAKTPAVTGIALTTLALTIGLNTAVFSIVNAVVLRPLPFPRSDRIIALCESDTGERDDWCGASTPDVADVAARSRTIAAAGIARSWPFLLKTVSGSEGVTGGLATPGAFRALGVNAAIGRLFDAEEIGANRQRVVVLSNEIWRSRFGARSDVLGRAITLDDEPHVIIGVLPPDTRVPLLDRVKIWRALDFDPRDEERRDWRGFQAFARLNDGVTLEQASREVATIAADIQRTHFAAKPKWTIGVRTWHEIVVGSVRRPMLIFLGAVGFVLLIGCANVANLLLARGAVREREVAVRAALGASRAELLRGSLIESLLLAFGGTALGLVVGSWATTVLVKFAPRGIPRIDHVGLDARVLAFTIGLSLLTTVLVGLVPALRASRVSLQKVLAEGGRTPTSRRVGRFASALIVAEISLAVVLVTGAGLLTRTLLTLTNWEPGFEQNHLLTTWAFVSEGKYRTSDAVASLFARAVDEIRTIPSVVAVGAGSAGPLFGGIEPGDFTIIGRPPTTTHQSLRWFDISPGYFRALGLPIVRGRDIAPGDVAGAPLVSVINESFARRYFANEDPIGQRVRLRNEQDAFTIVGIVRDTPPLRPGDPVEIQMYWSNRQRPRWASYFVIRSAVPPAAIVKSVRERLLALEPDMQLSQTQSMPELLSQELVRPRFNVILLGTFGVLALLLATIGTYGLFAYTVASRSREFGVRSALGASPGAIVSGVLLHGLGLAGIAVAIGLAASLALTRLLSSLLAGVSATDPGTFAMTALVLLAAAALACILPARRASRVDPMVALRMD
jgi:putative ABC transport system permease protein